LFKLKIEEKLWLIYFEETNAEVHLALILIVCFRYKNTIFLLIPNFF